MSNDLIHSLLEALGPRAVPNLANPIGADHDKTQVAIQTALPILLGALARNASQADGAQSLHRAIEEDHTQLELSDVLNSVSAGGGDGKEVLRHVLGPRQSSAAEGISQVTGIGRGQALQLLTMLAPLVLNYLGRRTRAQGMNADGLGAMLGQQRQQLETNGGVAGKLMNAVLDRDGDGDVDFSDIVGAFGKLGGSGESPVNSRH